MDEIDRLVEEAKANSLLDDSRPRKKKKETMKVEMVPLDSIEQLEVVTESKIEEIESIYDRLDDPGPQGPQGELGIPTVTIYTPTPTTAMYSAKRNIASAKNEVVNEAEVNDRRGIYKLRPDRPIKE